MTIAAVAFAHASGTHDVHSVSVTRTVVAGDPVGIIAIGNSGVATPSLSDNGSSGGNTYTPCSVASTTNTNYGMKLWLFYTNPTKSATSITADWGGANPEYAWIGVVGATGASAYDNDKAAYQASTGSSPDDITTGTQAPAQAPGLAYGFCMGPGATSPGTNYSFGTYANDAPVAGGGYTIAWVTEYLRYTSTSALAATWSQGSATYASSVMFLFKEATAKPGLSQASCRGGF